MRKLGKNERFIRTISELKQNNLPYDNLVKAVGYVLNYYDAGDEETVILHERLEAKNAAEVIKGVSQIEDEQLVNEIAKEYLSMKR